MRNFNPDTTILAYVGRGSCISQKCDVFTLHLFCCSAYQGEVDLRFRAYAAEFFGLRSFKGF
ncbi:hypothetical protein [Pseudoalteromonas obscura]|uniref:hypothetical protein n=1 Tax=Pseudoalteromonas obscura TaxID=3048491 RepID=UPI0024DE1680|nr:hypothetical protein [Pseudoalteromonas sp. P94(2023)]